MTSKRALRADQGIMRHGWICLLLFVFLFGFSRAACSGEGALYLQVVRPAGEVILWEAAVRRGQCFTIDYRHSSDHTPVLDVFRITDQGGDIVLIEESYMWYGAGLAFHPADGIMDLSGKKTRVMLHRKFPHFLLRVGEVADHVLTVNSQRVPLLQVAKGRELVWIRVMRKTGR